MSLKFRILNLELHEEGLCLKEKSQNMRMENV